MTAVLESAFRASNITAIVVNSAKDRVTKNILAFSASIAPLHSNYTAE